MNKETIIKITKIMCTTDNECPDCAGRLIQQLINLFPKYKEEIDKTFDNYFS